MQMDSAKAIPHGPPLLLYARPGQILSDGKMVAWSQTMCAQLPPLQFASMVAQAGG